jgi:Mg-chelatase subunit ChlD
VPKTSVPEDIPGEAGAICLPSCEDLSDELIDEELTTVLPSRELVRRLAESGVAGAQELLREEEKRGGRLAERLASLRERLRRQITRQTHRALDEYRSRELALDARFVQRRTTLAGELSDLDRARARARALDPRDLRLDSALFGAVRQALLLPDEAFRAASEPERRSIWARIVAFFRALLARLARLFRRGSKVPAPAATGPKGRTLTLGRISELGRVLTPDSAEALVGSLSEAQRAALARSAERSLERTRTETDAAMKQLASEQRRAQEDLRTEAQMARERAERRMDEEVRQGVEARLRSELAERGLVRERGGQLAVTYGLVERFARLVLEDESKSLPEDLRMSLQGAASTGLYEKGRLRQSDEIARLDLVSSLVESRLKGSRHLDEQSSYVYREVRAESLHAVLLLDTSGSMSEGGKLAAAKKAFLALYMAIHRRYPDATIDVATYDNEVRVRDLVSLWEAPPGAFTNTGEALHVAHSLLAGSRASRKELYLLTDGLPEAYSTEDGRVLSGQLDRAQAYALSRARELRRVSPLASTIVLLRSNDPAYEEAARELARALGGSLVLTDPARLAFELLVRFVGGRVEERTPREAASLRAPRATTPTGPQPIDNARARRKARRAAQAAGG